MQEKSEVTLDDIAKLEEKSEEETLKEEDETKISREYSIEERDALLFGSYKTERYGPLGRSAPQFVGLDLSKLKWLVQNGYLKSNDQHNGAPSAEEFLAFMAKHPNARLGGYAVNRRDESYIGLDSISFETSSPEAIADFAGRFYHADDFQTDWFEEKQVCVCFAWWD